MSVEDLDATIKRIRSTIFGLGASTRATTDGLRDRVTALADELAPSLPSRPRLTFDGPVDTVVADATADQLLTVLREMLSNVARHAQATHVDVTVAVDADTVWVQVVDDGVGAPLGAARQSAGMGLRNLAARAQRLGGHFTVGEGPAGGTSVEWRVPR